jgi:hypothetical protein
MPRNLKPLGIGESWIILFPFLKVDNLYAIHRMKYVMLKWKLIVAADWHNPQVDQFGIYYGSYLGPLLPNIPNLCRFQAFIMMPRALRLH